MRGLLYCAIALGSPAPISCNRLLPAVHWEPGVTSVCISAPPPPLLCLCKERLEIRLPALFPEKEAQGSMTSRRSIWVRAGERGVGMGGALGGGRRPLFPPSPSGSPPCHPLRKCPRSCLACIARPPPPCQPRLGPGLLPRGWRGVDLGAKVRLQPRTVAGGGGLMRGSRPPFPPY